MDAVAGGIEESGDARALSSATEPLNIWTLVLGKPHRRSQGWGFFNRHQLRISLMPTSNTGDNFNPSTFAQQVQAGVEQALIVAETEAAQQQKEMKLRQQYERLKDCYLSNRVSEHCKPVPAYERAVGDWALQSKANRHEHCETLLQAVANPMMLDASLSELMPKLKRREQELENCETDSSMKWRWLRAVQQALLDKKFRRGKYEKYKIAKPGRTGFRTIEVPNTDTRIVARTMLSVLSPLLDPNFYQLSIGFRKHRSPLHGIAAAEQLAKRGMTHWVKCDIRDAFGQIPKPPLLDVLKSRLHGSSIMWLVEEILDKHRKRGIPQGVAISPLAMNVYLDRFLDRWWVKRFPGTCLVRYADDILIACPTRQSAIAAFNALEEQTKTIGMPLKERQTDAVFDLSGGEMVDWLGFQIRLHGDEFQCSLGVKSWDRLEDKLQEVRARKTKGECYTDADITSIGFGRVHEKAIAINEQQVPAVAHQIRELAEESKLDMSGFTDGEALRAWLIGQEKWQEAREQVLQWLPAA